MAEPREPWAMPAWMESFRVYVEADVGGNTAEDLLNDTTTNGFNNVIRAAFISMVESKVKMLHALKRDGLLVVPTEKRKPGNA